jgi:protein-L-isoaspartate(D-aspartate) O-methyltransferase
MPAPTEDQVFRNQMVAKIKAQNLQLKPDVEQAMLVVPRHKFAHWLSLEQAYALAAHSLPGVSAETMSTISHPSAVALMLEPLELQPGHRVLEIGAGTGYNAALIAQIVGLTGCVTTVDIEAFIVAGAKTNLRSTGFERVKVILGDGSLGYKDHAPYDRITATVGVWEIPLEWFEQLEPNGRIAIPLHLFGDSSDHDYVVLEHQGNHLAGYQDIGLRMVKMRGGTGAHPSVPETITSDFPKVTPKHVNLKVYKKTDPEAPNPQQLEINGNHARIVLEKKQTVVDLDIEISVKN